MPRPNLPEPRHAQLQPSDLFVDIKKHFEYRGIDIQGIEGDAYVQTYALKFTLNSRPTLVCYPASADEGSGSLPLSSLDKFNQPSYDGHDKYWIIARKRLFSKHYLLAYSPAPEDGKTRKLVIVDSRRKLFGRLYRQSSLKVAQQLGFAPENVELQFTGKQAITDTWSCGYHAAHNLEKFLSSTRLRSNNQLSFKLYESMRDIDSNKNREILKYASTEINKLFFQSNLSKDDQSTSWAWLNERLYPSNYRVNNKASSRAVLSGSGFLAGAAAGASAGFVFGAPFFGLGAIPGAIIGGVAGGIAGGFIAFGGAKAIWRHEEKAAGIAAATWQAVKDNVEPAAAATTTSSATAGSDPTVDRELATSANNEDDWEEVGNQSVPRANLFTPSTINPVRTTVLTEAIIITRWTEQNSNGNPDEAGLPASGASTPRNTPPSTPRSH